MSDQIGQHDIEIFSTEELDRTIIKIPNTGSLLLIGIPTR